MQGITRNANLQTWNVSSASFLSSAALLCGQLCFSQVCWCAQAITVPEVHHQGNTSGSCVLLSRELRKPACARVAFLQVSLSMMICAQL